jgi:carbon starvation protein
MKIFSPDPRLGFLSGAAAFADELSGSSASGAAAIRRQIFNLRVDAAVMGLLLVLVAAVVAANGRVWWGLLSGRRRRDLREEPYVAIGPAAGEPSTG